MKRLTVLFAVTLSALITLAAGPIAMGSAAASTPPAAQAAWWRAATASTTRSPSTAWR